MFNSWGQVMSADLGAKEKILDSALEIFGEKGFKSATVREICNKAGVSIALINYHFRDKQGLYNEMVISIFKEMVSCYPIEKYVDKNVEAKLRLKGVIRLLMFRILGAQGLGKDQFRLKLVSRELSDPTPTLDIVFTEYIGEMKDLILGIVREVTGTEDHETLHRALSCIAGECLHPLFAGELLKRAGFYIGNTDKDVERHAEFIYKFTLAGLEKIKEGQK